MGVPERNEEFSRGVAVQFTGLQFVRTAEAGAQPIDGNHILFKSEESVQIAILMRMIWQSEGGVVLSIWISRLFPGRVGQRW
jgi:hypothetical protein